MKNNIIFIYYVLLKKDGKEYIEYIQTYFLSRMDKTFDDSKQYNYTNTYTLNATLYILVHTLILVPNHIQASHVENY